MMTTIENITYDMERSLYGQKDLILKNCAFDGPSDGESALKECSNIVVENTFCNLRYPFWHDHGLKISNCTMTELCRAAIWYSDNIEISSSHLHGIKALRECRNIQIKDCDIISPEFGWSVKNLEMKDSTAESEYFLMRGENLHLENISFKGKYSFQYTENLKMESSTLDTKDAFWHTKNAVLKDCTINGEYLAWYSENLTLINCRITGTQPFCYCKGLKLIDCEMIGTDLCFEKSEVEATIKTHVISIKNPASGTITVPSVGDIIIDDANAKGKITVLG